MKKFILTLVTLAIAGYTATAQLDLGLLLEAGAKDTEKYLSNYFEPAFTGFGFAMNGGWYNTAKPHKLFGFDITVSGTAAYVPDPETLWKFRDQDFESMRLFDPNGIYNGETSLPTLYGPNTDPDELPELQFVDPDNGEEIVRVSALTGMGLKEAEIPIITSNVTPAPQVQASLGLIKDTEVIFRFIPERDYDVDDSKVVSGMWGLGVKHNFKQWIPGLSAIPIDLSVLYGYSKLNTSYILDKDLKQSFDLSTTSNTFQVIASKNISVLTVYSGIGFSAASASLSMKGDYELDNGDVLSNPVSFDGSGSTFRGSLGARVKLLVLTIHAEYVLQRYNLFTAGIGISVR